MSTEPPASLNFESKLPDEVRGVINTALGALWVVPEIDSCEQCAVTPSSQTCKALPLCGGDSDYDGSIVFIHPEKLNEYRAARVVAKLRV